MMNTQFSCIDDTFVNFWYRRKSADKENRPSTICFVFWDSKCSWVLLVACQWLQMVILLYFVDNSVDTLLLASDPNCLDQ